MNRDLYVCAGRRGVFYLVSSAWSIAVYGEGDSEAVYLVAGCLVSRLIVEPHTRTGRRHQMGQIPVRCRRSCLSNPV